MAAIMSNRTMPFLMPDGTRLSSLIDRAEPTRQKKSSKSKQPYKHRLDALYELKGDADASEVAAVSRLGARSRLRCDADHVRCTEGARWANQVTLIGAMRGCEPCGEDKIFTEVARIMIMI
jgi:hypothetical protein